MREKERKVLGGDLSISRDEIRIVVQKKKIRQERASVKKKKINLHNH